MAFQPAVQPEPEVPDTTPTVRKPAMPVKATAHVAEPDTDQNTADDSADTAPEITETPPADTTADDDEGSPALTNEGFPARVGTLRVVREELLFALGKHAPFRYSRLHLEDGSTCIACRDCWFTAETRGEVMQHRNAIHGAHYGKKKPRVNLPAEQGSLDLVLEPRDDGTAVPNSPMDWTLRELMAVMPTIGALGNLVDQLETERNDLRAELAAVRVGTRDDERKIAAYEMHRTEILELRRWKNDVIKKFGALGFKFEDDEE